MAAQETGPELPSEQRQQALEAGWVRREREAALSLLTGGESYHLPEQGSVSREFADARYREVTARISATAKDMGEIIAQRDRARDTGRSVPEALAWTGGALVVVVLGVLLGELAAAAGSAILEGLNE